MAPVTTTANGVLPVPAAILQKQPPKTSNGRDASKKGSSPRGPRLKVVIRRLAPGLTEAEFQTALGEEWRIGGGKVDWFEYHVGKVSKDLAKPSRPARAYLHLTDPAHLNSLSEKFRQTTFTDAKNSARDSALIGPPALEFAPYNRIPGGRKRNDARQGTIDQDPDFQEFLESLTNPIPKPVPIDVGGAEKKEEKITTTPLIEHLREKKAAKEKPQAKAAIKHGRQESKGKDGKKSKAEKDGAPAEKTKRMTKAEKAAKEAVKVLNREASASNNSAAEKTQAAAAPSERPKREPRPMNIQARIQKDLGLGPAARRAARKEKAAEETKVVGTTSSKDSPKAGAASPAPAPAATATSPARGRNQRGQGNRRSSKTALTEKTNVSSSSPEATKAAPVQPVLLKKPTVQPTPKVAVPTQPAAQSQKVAPGAATEPSTTSPIASPPATTNSGNGPRQAFLKHANPSQGITEPLIHAALSVYGAIEKVEIDKRKGFAYVDFVDADGLRKAIAASPVKVAQGAVQVLEKRDRVGGRLAPSQIPPAAPTHPHGPPRGGRFGGRGRGGHRGGRGGHVNHAPVAPAAQPAATGT